MSLLPIPQMVFPLTVYPIHRKKSIGKAKLFLQNSAEQDAETLKQKQPDIILENDPAWADDRTWIRSAKDIKTFSEVTTPAVIEDGYTPDYTGEDMRKALTSGYVTVV